MAAAADAKNYTSTGGNKRQILSSRNLESPDKIELVDGGDSTEAVQSKGTNNKN